MQIMSKQMRISIAGSGNMGIMATVPIIAFDEIKKEENDNKNKLIKSITLSIMTTIYDKPPRKPTILIVG